MSASTIQKKVCMVGLFGTGKTCLVQRFVHSIFSVKYHSTVGVKIDRKPINVDGTEVTLLLWDLAGRHEDEDVSPSYLRGSHGIIYVVDGTRRETFEQVFDLRALADRTVGELPSVAALNKSDLTDAWLLGDKDVSTLTSQRFQTFPTSAKNGQGVETAFAWLARAMVGSGGTAG
jgi:small GTP-binding protein